MRWAAHIFIVLLGCAGGVRCGQVAGAPSDARPDDATEDEAAARCSGLFGSATPIAELNTPVDERSLRLSDDELTAAFSRVDGVAGDAAPPYGPPYGPYAGIYVANRSTSSGRFTSPIEVGVTRNPPGIGSAFPSLTADGTSLFYEGDCTDGPGDSILCLACGDGGLTSFGHMCQYPVHLNIVRPWTTVAYFGAYAYLGNGYITSNVGAYYFATQIDDAGLVNGIFVGGRPVGQIWPDVSFGGAPDATGGNATFTPMITPSGPSDPAALVNNPIVTSDELTMYVSVPDGVGIPHVQVAARSSTAEPFGTLKPVHELDSAEGEYASWISVDQCRIYLSRKVGGQWDLFVASRAP